MNIFSMGFDVDERSKRIRCLIAVHVDHYAQWESSLKICGKYNKGTVLNTVLMVNKCHMGVFCMRFEIGRWGY